MKLLKARKLVIFLVFALISSSFANKAETKKSDDISEPSETSKSETKELDPRQLFALDPAGIRIIL